MSQDLGTPLQSVQASHDSKALHNSEYNSESRQDSVNPLKSGVRQQEADCRQKEVLHEVLHNVNMREDSSHNVNRSSPWISQIG